MITHAAACESLFHLPYHPETDVSGFFRENFFRNNYDRGVTQLIAVWTLRNGGKMMSNGLLQSIADNVTFVLVCIVVAAGLFAAAYAAEKYAYKKNGIAERILSTRKIAMIGLFSAIAVILHIFDFPILFLAPGFYKLDFSEIPALVGAFAFGPVAGVMIEFCKILLKLVIKGTSTAFVGDLANFVIGCSLVLPASVIYMFKKTKKTAVLSCLAGSVFMTVFGTAFNGIYLLPAFSALYGMPMDAIIGMGTEINSNINSVTTFVCFAVAPINIIKSAAASVVTLVIYKPLSPIIKSAQIPTRQHAADKTHTI